MVDSFTPPWAMAGFTPGARVASYRLVELIGRGGMAVVFKALDERLNRQVALKILALVLAEDEAFRQRFIRESRAAAAVDDPNIIPVYEAGEADGVLFIAMRLVRGGNLRSLVAQHGPLPSSRAEQIVSDTASALDAAHAAGLVHRDVKPANVLLESRRGRTEHVYLSDFGLSKAALGTSGLTVTGQFLGTPDYAAPEQIQGHTVDGRTDQYALGCTAFELLCGQPPFMRDQAISTVYAHLWEPPPAVSNMRPELPAAVDAVFSKVLAKSPADRYVSCQEFADALHVALGVVLSAAGKAAAEGERTPTDVAWPGTVPDDAATIDTPEAEIRGGGHPSLPGAALTGHPSLPDAALTGHPSLPDAALTGHPSLPDALLAGHPSLPDPMHGAETLGVVEPVEADLERGSAPPQREAWTPMPGAVPEMGEQSTGIERPTAGRWPGPGSPWPEPAPSTDPGTPPATGPDSPPSGGPVPEGPVPSPQALLPTVSPPDAAGWGGNRLPADDTVRKPIGIPGPPPDDPVMPAPPLPASPAHEGQPAALIPPVGTFPPGGGSPPAAPPSRPRRRPILLWAAAAALVVAGGVAGGLLLIRPAHTPKPAPAPATVSHAFAPHTIGGVVIAKLWKLAGRNESTLSVRIAVSSATGQAVAVKFSEPFPAAIAPVLRNNLFTPPPTAITNTQRVVEWNLNVPAHGDVVITYQARVSTKPPTRAALDSLVASFNAVASRESVVAAAPHLKSLKIRPAKLKLTVGRSRHVRLSGRLSNGKKLAATVLSMAHWTTAKPSVATVKSGKITARGPGRTRVTARIGGITVSLLVTVVAAPAPAPSPAPTSYQPPPPPPSNTPTPTPSGTPTPKL